MHTASELTATDFAFRRDGTPVNREDVLPAIDVEDRLGVVMADPVWGLGAGTFVLACVTAFYDRLREREDAFYEYPDYYTFQATPEPIDYLEFDIWPAHKHVAVPPDPERVLQAVNDRAITTLLVPETTPRGPSIEDVTLNSARRRIDACYQYAPDGHVTDPDFHVEVAHDPAARWFRETLDAIDTPTPFRLPGAGTPIRQSFRHLDLDDALDFLPAGDA